MDGPGPRWVVALDVGTTEVKAAAFAVADGAPASGARPPGSRSPVVATAPLVTHHPAPGRAEQDPLAVLTAAGDALVRCLAALGTRAGYPPVVDLVTVTTAMHALVGVGADLVPRTPLVLWSDHRATAEALDQRRHDPTGLLVVRTGTPAHPMTPLAKLAWWHRNHPEVAAEVRWWLGLKDWVLWWLTGRVVTERSSAGGTGLCAVETGTWDPEAVALAGVEIARLPPVAEPTDVVGLSADRAASLGLPAGTPVVLGAADGPVSNLGVGATAPGQLALTVGTSAAVRSVVARPVTRGDGSSFCYPLARDRWVVGAALANAGSALDWVVRTVSDGRDVDALLDAASHVAPGSDELVVVPFLDPERAPRWHPDRAGAVLGLRSHHGRAHLARATVEAVALQVAVLEHRVVAVVPAPAPGEVRASGGALRHPLWRTTLAAALGRPLSVVGDVAGTALGAAALGWWAVGGADSPEAARRHLVGDGEAVEVVAPDQQARAALEGVAGRLAALAGDLAADAAEVDTVIGRRGEIDPV